MSEHSNDTLTGLVTIAPNVNLGDMKKLIEDIEGIPVSKTTIHRTLSELDFICGKPSEKPLSVPKLLRKESTIVICIKVINSQMCYSGMSPYCSSLRIES